MSLLTASLERTQADEGYLLQELGTTVGPEWLTVQVQAPPSERTAALRFSSQSLHARKDLPRGFKVFDPASFSCSPQGIAIRLVNGDAQ